MRKTLHFCLTLILVSFFISCDSLKGDDPSESYLGKWKLTEYKSSWFPGATPVSELGYSEFYEFRSNGTFSKSNSELDRVLTGTYVVTPAQDEFKENFLSELTLKYNSSDLEGLPTENDGLIYTNREPYFWIIYGRDETEVVFLKENGTLTNAGYGWADGGEYIYRK